MKYALLAAAAVFAVGTSQAAAVESTDTYEVITLPVAEGYNLYGVSVTPISDEPQVSSVFNGIGGEFRSEGDIVAVTASLAVDAIWYNAGESEVGLAYEVGKVKTAPASVSVASKATVLVPVVADFALGSLTVEGESLGVSRYKTGKSLEISVWNTETQSYVKYWYKTDDKWYTQLTKEDASAVQLKAGQAFYVSANSGAATISF
ncbi:MAG: hypothetical protein IJ678_01305 [Kiritimatiellae bacterium]|nr:hypothetical protein [Kiritimatiellia bacterium]